MGTQALIQVVEQNSPPPHLWRNEWENSAHLMQAIEAQLTGKFSKVSSNHSLFSQFQNQIGDLRKLVSALFGLFS